MYNHHRRVGTCRVGGKYMKVHSYHTAGGNDLILEFLSTLSPEEKAEGFYILELLETGSFEDLHKLDVKHFESKVWEIRFRKFNRIFYVLMDKENIYLLHGCKKQKNAAELNDKNLAIERAKEIK